MASVPAVRQARSAVADTLAEVERVQAGALADACMPAWICSDRLSLPEPEGPSRATILSGAKHVSRWFTARCRPAELLNSLTRSCVCSSQQSRSDSSITYQDTSSSCRQAGLLFCQAQGSLACDVFHVRVAQGMQMISVHKLHCR